MDGVSIAHEANRKVKLAKLCEGRFKVGGCVLNTMKSFAIGTAVVFCKRYERAIHRRKPREGWRTEDELISVFWHRIYTIISSVSN
jgi:hypothetical protein